MPNRPFMITVAALVGAALSLGPAAHADPSDPTPGKMSADGQVHSEQAARVAGSQPCAVNVGTASGETVHTSDSGTPMQVAKEAGPEWVGSDGWQAQGISRSNPWGGNFDPSKIHTGMACKPVTAGGFS
ncbi:hypothetical protein ACAG25_03695 [Mycobacterium sp. pV006]|uniref:hypothetical protein n=1 Tax=Mycobacterium sp. pV006 TaxID=3238983 RepID=UPI00351B8272